ncbi:MAG: 6,7-dimethyl-8-ribityllumazine synthase [Myxococcales bacterium]
MSSVKSIEGALVVPEGAKFAIVGSRFNSFIVERLIEGAIDALVRHGAAAENITVVRVPGSWEIPLVCARLAGTGKLDAVVALGAVIRGATPHFDHVANEVSKGVAQASMDSGVPISFGVLTTDSIEQAVERAGTKAGNKGFDAAVAAIEMVTLGKQLSQQGL